METLNGGRSPSGISTSTVFQVSESSHGVASNPNEKTLVGGCLLYSRFGMIVPLPYQVPCPVEVQPVNRRFVAAPYEGKLAEVLVERGEAVQQGQVLAKMDRQKLEFEKAAVVAEIASARKKVDAARGERRIAEAQMAQSDIKAFQAKLNLLDQRLANLDIKSPIEGVLIRGEIEKIQGAPVELGQSLFEIGPLDKMSIQVRIAERDISMVQAGVSVTIRCRALPYRKLTGILERIHPCAEMIDDEQVFVGEVVVDNPEGRLRPGLRGRAQIQSKWRSLSWRLFHRSYESFRYWLIW